MAAAETTLLTPVQLIPPCPNARRGYGYNMDAVAANKKYAARMAYGTGHNTWIRRVDEPNVGFMHRNHHGKVMTTRFHPNAGWLLSADDQGKYKVWAIRNDGNEPVFKNEGECGKSCNDCGWSGDGKRIIMGGDGKEEKGKCVPWDSTNQNGVFTNPLAPIISLDFRHKRPFRVVVSSEDSEQYFYKGPPFKLMAKNSEHHKFVNCVRFSPNCDYYASCAGDKKIFIYDGKTGDLVRPLIENGTCHGGSIYSVVWSPDSTRLASASADKTIKIWDVESGDCLFEIPIGRQEIRDMQVSVMWPREDLILSLSVDGDMQYINTATGEVEQVVSGAKTAIPSLAINQETNDVFMCSQEGKVCKSNIDGSCVAFRGYPHGRFRAVKKLALSCDGTKLYSSSPADGVCCTDTSGLEMGADLTMVGGAVRFLAPSPTDPAICITANNRGAVHVMTDGQITQTIEQGGSFYCGCWNTSGDRVFVGTGSGNILTFTYADGELAFEADNNFNNTTKITHVSVSHDNVTLVAVMEDRQIRILNSDTFDLIINSSLKYHTGVVTSVAWDPTSNNMMTVSSDNSVVIMDDPRVDTHRRMQENVHVDGILAGGYLADGTMVTAGGDAALRFWQKS